MTDPLYVLHPGVVISRTDGDRHYIGQSQLISLYRVPPSARVAVDNGRPGRRWPDDAIHCRPLYDGDYPVFRALEATDD